MNRDDALALLARMELWARNKVIITIPNGSVMSVSEWRRAGYHAYGLDGFASLRTSSGKLRHISPFYFWLVLSDISQLFCYFAPSLAYRLFLVKDIQ